MVLRQDQRIEAGNPGRGFHGHHPQGEQEGALRGYNPNRHGRAGHHPLLAFVSEARMVANFWLRPGNAHSANNILQFLESTLHHLGDKGVGLLRADSGFFDEAILAALESKRIPTSSLPG